MQPLNYTVKAIENLTALAEGAGPSSRADILGIVDKLRQAEIFVLPDHGTLLDRSKPPVEVPGLMFRPPFPVVALEYQSPEAGGRPHHEIYSAISAPRRIALAWLIPAATPLETDAVAVASICYFDQHQHWMPVACAAKWSFDFNWTERRNETPFFHEMVRSGGISKSSAQARTMEMELLPIWRDALDMALVTQGVPATIDAMSADLMDEVNAYRDLCYTLACGNVRAERRAAAAALNKTRIKAGKLPLKDYHVLTIDGRGQGEDEGFAGLRNGPRSHLRRGHIRRLDAQRVTWVNAAMVRGRGGFVDKQYRIGGAS